MHLTNDNERFSREAAAGYDREVIDNADIVLVGTGALGQFMALCLALVGYPRITFVDMETFEESNATRSPFYENGVTKAKATAVGALDMCTATGQRIYRYAVSPIQQLGDVVFESASAVISAVDCMMARTWLAQRTRKHRVPLIEGGFHGERINSSTLLNASEDQPCWACGQVIASPGRVFSCDAYARQVQDLGFIPATAPGAMALAAIMTGQLTQILHGNHELANTTLAADLRMGTMRLSRRATDPACMLDHRSARNVVDLECTPQDSVSELLRQICGNLPEPMVELPAAFIRTVPCRSCRVLAAVNRPEWAISGPPLCTACGGQCARTGGVPEQHGSLSQQTSGSIADLRLEQVGIGPRQLLDVNGRGRRQTFRIAGDCESLFFRVS